MVIQFEKNDSNWKKPPSQSRELYPESNRLTRKAFRQEFSSGLVNGNGSLGEIITLYRTFYKKNENFVKKHTNLKAYANVRRIPSRQRRQWIICHNALANTLT